MIHPRAPLGRPLLLASLLALAAGVGCAKQDAGPTLPPPLVTVDIPTRSDVVLNHEFTGTSRPVASAEVRARVPGTLDKVLFAPSELVEAGRLLFVIEPALYDAARDQAQGTLKAAEADLAKASSDLERISEAIKSNAVSRQDLDLAMANKLKAEGSLLAAQANLKTAETNYEYTQVRSPITGAASRNLVDVGNLVGATERTLLTTVNQMDPMYVYFNAPESVVLAYLGETDGQRISELSDEQKPRAFVRLTGDPGFPHEGYIDYIDNTVDPTTGTIQVRAVIPNPHGLLFPGLFVRVRVPGTTSPDALLVDERAVGTDLGGKYVYVVGAGNVVEQRYITLGERQDDGTIVVLDGLDGSESYIVNGILKARPGLPVTPQPRDATAPAGNAAGS